MPVSLGVARALWVTRVFHAIAVFLLTLTGLTGDRGVIYFVGLAIVAVLLAYENAIVSEKDLSRVNTAFMTMNGIISVVYIAFLTVDLLVH